MNWPCAPSEPYDASTRSRAIACKCSSYSIEFRLSLTAPSYTEVSSKLLCTTSNFQKFKHNANDMIYYCHQHLHFQAQKLVTVGDMKSWWVSCLWSAGLSVINHCWSNLSHYSCSFSNSMLLSWIQQFHLRISSTEVQAVDCIWWGDSAELLSVICLAWVWHCNIATGITLSFNKISFNALMVHIFDAWQVMMSFVPTVDLGTKVPVIFWDWFLMGFQTAGALYVVSLSLNQEYTLNIPAVVMIDARIESTIDMPLVKLLFWCWIECDLPCHQQPAVWPRATNRYVLACFSIAWYCTACTILSQKVLTAGLS